MKLYLVSTVGFGDYYIIANDPTSAENKILSILNESDYGFSSERGVIKHNDKWVSAIYKDNIMHYLGVFDDIIEAAVAYDKMALLLYGGLAKLNFKNIEPVSA